MMVHKTLWDSGHFTISWTAVNRQWQEACRELVVYARHFTASMQQIPEDHPLAMVFWLVLTGTWLWKMAMWNSYRRYPLMVTSTTGWC